MNEQMISLNEKSQTSNSSPQQSLSSTLSALKDLNQSLSPDRQIKMLLFLYSRYSEKSDMLIRSLPQEIRGLFHYICIDNKVIRSKILNSSTTRLEEVPSIILIENSNSNVFTFEGDRTIEIIKNIHGIYKNHLLSKHPQNCQCPAHKKDTKGSVTPIASLMSEAGDSPYPEEAKRPPRSSPIPDRIPVPVDDEEVTQIDVDSPEDSFRTNAVRAKVRRANRPIGEISIRQEDPPEVGLSSVRNFPAKGVGHEKMKISSLPQGQPSKKKQPAQMNQMEISGGEMLGDLDDIEEMLEEEDIDPTLDPEIRNSLKARKGGAIDKKETMMDVKNMAAEMMKARGEFDEE